MRAVSVYVLFLASVKKLLLASLQPIPKILCHEPMNSLMRLSARQFWCSASICFRTRKIRERENCSHWSFSLLLLVSALVLDGRQDSLWTWLETSDQGWWHTVLATAKKFGPLVTITFGYPWLHPFLAVYLVPGCMTCFYLQVTPLDLYIYFF